MPRGEELGEWEVNEVGEGNNCRGVQQPSKLEIRCDDESTHGEDKKKTDFLNRRQGTPMGTCGLTCLETNGQLDLFFTDFSH